MSAWVGSARVVSAWSGCLVSGTNGARKWQSLVNRKKAKAGGNRMVRAATSGGGAEGSSGSASGGASSSRTPPTPSAAAPQAQQSSCPASTSAWHLGHVQSSVPASITAAATAVASGSSSPARILSASWKSSAATRTLTPPRAMEKCHPQAPIVSPSRNARIPAASSRFLIRWASSGVPYLVTILRLPLICDCSLVPVSSSHYNNMGRRKTTLRIGSARRDSSTSIARVGCSEAKTRETCSQRPIAIHYTITLPGLTDKP